MRTSWIVFTGALLLALFTFVPSTADAQRLRRASGVVRGEPRRAQSTTRRERRTTRDPVRVTARRRWAPLIVTGPYVAITSDEPAAERFLRITIAGEGQYVLDGIGHGALTLRVGFAWPVELHAAYGVYVEPLARGVEALGLGRLGIAGRLVDLPEVQARVGLALRHVHDRLGGIAGIEGFGGIDVTPLEPLVISIEGGVGVVGEGWVLAARATVGLAAGPIEIYAGWEHVAFEPIDAELGGGTWLSGPVLGVRAWL
ncbi:hypothetical protein [Sandaracinus amylolyticus]|uniref:Uncharacterized protein n=1 Tax=Sandaracinus amylolyticus TaxID=927083 RepID=A0A0F6SH22_9BACT|nr:hypothetical protein [Sandaracinus amylolyticus]AKF09689.1 hypothetical protein DB32_006838 [Sandaracinus amylolyticus]